MDRSDRFNCLQFEDNRFIHQQVEPIADVEQLLSVVNDWYRNLLLHPQATLRKFIRQARLVRAFQQSWAKLRMYLEGRVARISSVSAR